MSLMSIAPGAIIMGHAIAVLFFLKFWRKTGDGLFLAFAAAFLLMGLVPLLTNMLAIPREEQSPFYLIRLAAFLLIIGAVAAKSRTASGTSATRAVDIVLRRGQRLIMIESRADRRPGFYEFFCGGGMVRAGLGEGWRCLFANDIDPRKAASWRANWGPDGLHVGDIAALTADDLPGEADLMWGSFPCQDLSLAGVGAGLGGRRSGTFHAFWSLARELASAGRAPAMVVVENVCGALTSRGGVDFEIICRTFVEAGYRCGALVINADRFLPQSRPRLFIIGVRAGIDPGGLVRAQRAEPFHPAALRRAVERLPDDLRPGMIWWDVPAPKATPASLEQIIEPDGPDLVWHGADRTSRLLALMSPTNQAKVDAVRRAGGGVGAVFRRTRRGPDGAKLQRAEVRFDRAGCLRTPAGGSSRQILLIVEPDRVRSRLMTGRETARLMGLPDDYTLPSSHGAACHLTGDGVAVPVVRSLAEHLFEPLVSAEAPSLRAA